MKTVLNDSRRQLLKNVALGTVLVPLSAISMHAAFGADTPLVTEEDPTAKALKYVADASKATGATPGSKCGNCSLFQGAAGSAQGPCLLFPGKAVKATGWCMSWTAKAA